MTDGFCETCHIEIILRVKSVVNNFIVFCSTECMDNYMVSRLRYYNRLIDKISKANQRKKK